jgi:hypothetical protein
MTILANDHSNLILSQMPFGSSRPLSIGAKNARVLFVGKPVEANSTESSRCKFSKNDFEFLRVSRFKKARPVILSRLAWVVIFCFLFYLEKRENQTNTLNPTTLKRQISAQ